MTEGVPIAAQRRHTLYFLESIRDFAPVFLDTEVDMGRVLAHRAAARARGTRYSLVSYVLLAAWPHPGPAPRGERGHPRLLLRPKVARYDTVNGKFTLDKRVGGHRVVLSTVVRGIDTASLDAVQERVDHFRDGDPDTMPEFAPVRELHRLSWARGRRLAARATGSLTTHPLLYGTLAVTSLGHRDVDSFHSVGGTTVTLGVGRILDRPVVRDGAVTVAPVMRLSLAFDHRVIDGAEAADVLTDVKRHLETFDPEARPAATGTAAARPTVRGAR